MDNIKSHIRRFGLLHAGWIIVILFLCLCAIVMGKIDAHKIGDFVSLIASVVSIILALVAIFYAFVSNQSFFQTIGILKTSTDDISVASTKIADLTSEMTATSNVLLEKR